MIEGILMVLLGCAIGLAFFLIPAACRFVAALIAKANRAIDRM
jgi:uncharacterized membrane protein